MRTHATEASARSDATASARSDATASARSDATASARSDATARVGVALRERLAARDHTHPVSESELREAARAVVAAARPLPPEAVLVAVKQSWSSHPDLRRFGPGMTPNEALSALVAMCIHEYFASSPVQSEATGALSEWPAGSPGNAS